MNVKEFYAQWVQGRLPSSGRKAHASVFVDDDILYDYGYHYVMAIRLPDKVFLVNSKRYSATTSQHRSQVLRAIHAEGGTSVHMDGLLADTKRVAMTPLGTKWKPHAIISENVLYDKVIAATEKAGYSLLLPFGGFPRLSGLEGVPEVVAQALQNRAFDQYFVGRDK